MRNSWYAGAQSEQFAARETFSLRCLGFDVHQRASRLQALIRRVGVTSESKKERTRALSSSRARVYIASRYADALQKATASTQHV
jgi:hypothetical protein